MWHLRGRAKCKSNNISFSLSLSKHAKLITDLVRVHGLVGEGVDIERNEQSVEEVVDNHIIQTLDVERENV